MECEECKKEFQDDPEYASTFPYCSECFFALQEMWDNYRKENK